MTKPAASTHSGLLTGFNSGLGAIVNLVSEASEKTSPWVTARIEKFSKKAQDEIYGRFNAAFNDGVKDDAKGREFLKSSLDFMALTEKVTEVADDIEHADKIHKLFQKNAPIKTIHDQYNTLSLAARKEIEKHLSTTAVQAKPQKLQKALISVFGGMGLLDGETVQLSDSRASSKTSSSSAASNTSSKSTRPRNVAEQNDDSELAEAAAEMQTPEAQAQIKSLVLHLAKTVKKDIDLANAHVNIIAPKDDLTPEAIKARDEGIPKLYQKFSKAARCMIEKILIQNSQGSTKPYTSADEATPEHLREAIHEFFDVYVWSGLNYDVLLKMWKFNEEEVAITHFYYRIAQDFCKELPRFKDMKPVIADNEFEKIAETAVSKLINTSIPMRAYAQLIIKVIQLPYKQAMAMIRKENSFLTNILDQIQNPAIGTKGSFELFSKGLNKGTQEAIQSYLNKHHDGVAFKKASKAQMAEAAQDYISTLVIERVEKQQEADRLKEAALGFAVIFLKDYNILRQNAPFFKSKEVTYKQDLPKVLEIFDSLSSFAKLLVEQTFIRDYPAFLASQKAKADTMRALVAEASPDFSKGSMLRLLDGVNSNVVTFSITHGMKLENLGTTERLLLKAYLGYPRHITFAFLQSNPNGTAEALANYISKNMESLHKSVIDEFKATLSDIAEQEEQVQTIAKSYEDTKTKDELLFENRFFTKKDFFDEAMSLKRNTAETLDQ